MLVSLIKKDKMYNLTLPSKIAGSYWLCDEYKKDSQRKVISIEENNGKWVLKSNVDSPIIINNQYYESIILEMFKFYTVFLKEEKLYATIYCQPVYDNSFEQYDIRKNNEFMIGSGNDSAIFYKSSLIEHNQATLYYKDQHWAIVNNTKKDIVFVNNRITNHQNLLNGDVIFIMGLKIIIINNTLFINNPKNLVICNERFFSKISKNVNKIRFSNDADYFNDDKEYYIKSPRIRTKLIKEELVIDPPPAKKEPEDRPFIYTVGPMLTMSMVSIVMMYNAIAGVQDGTREWKDAIPTLVMSGAMILTMLMWPLLLKLYQKRSLKKKENLRQAKYSSYLTTKKYELDEIIKKQHQAMHENFVSLEKCQDIIVNTKSNLWEREIDQEDFLTLRLGISEMEPLLEINYEKEKFTLEDDNLKQQMLKIVNSYDVIKDVPLTLSFVDKFIVGLTGEKSLLPIFLKGLLLQIITFHSYDDVKIILFTNENNEKSWDFLKVCPHLWNDDRTLRFFATNIDDIKEVSLYLEKVFIERNEKESQKENDKEKSYKNYNPYYLIITDDFNLIRSTGIVKMTLEQEINLGFSLIINSDQISHLPNECMSFISVTSTAAGLFEDELVTNEGKPFIADINHNLLLQYCCSKLANIPIEYKSGRYKLPNVIGFLEMYEAGKVEQLNSLNRWKENNPISSLQAPIGLDEQGEIFKLDLHEKTHGPHGLIAGMTGSGKSEFIITYVLSLAVNYHPYEVSFVLIDYKGGGLAGAFENNITGVKLPHLAGTITNLDTVEMKRSLASIESELKRRQIMFNQARESLNESTIDIYKYQKFYREGLVKEPISHLFIISDEFAELKSQQPEFMDKLISTARIGRSLGVHLILATQKPAGVVNDQIWSNSRFRVCLKVQEKADSMDMIKVPDAAALKETGRFYLQVGYNELFALGQSAWCGKKYMPQEKMKVEIDGSIDFIDNIGNTIKSVDIPKKIEVNVQSQGEELTNIVKYLSDIAAKENININQLWLDRIPNEIYVDNLIKKYNYHPQSMVINPIIGEYDDPNHQKQDLLTLPLSKEGNTVIYGTAGSGKELLLNTLIYSTICHHSPKEVNFYIIDFGSETFKIFHKAPHVGDVLISSEEEKIYNLFKMLNSIIDKRKRLFFDYNGSYELYCKSTKQVIPRIIVIINNFDGFKEVYNDYLEDLQQLTREGFKYGIIFVISTTGTNSVSYRLLQNISKVLVLQLNDKVDYTSILGNCNGVYPSNALGRGIFKKDEAYEFQTAHITTNEQFNDYINQICTKLDNYYQIKADPIPILPEKVTINLLQNEFNQLPLLPIGISKEELKVTKFNFMEKVISIVTTNDTSNLNRCLNPLIKELTLIPNVTKLILDLDQIVKPFQAENYVHLTNGGQDIVDQLLAKIKAGLRKNVIVVIVGMNKFTKKLTNSRSFVQLLEQAKQSKSINIIAIDSTNNFKKMEYDSWYRDYVDNKRGIFVGYGLTEQNIIKYKGYIRKEEDLGNQFGYVVENGNYTLVKLIERDD